MNNDRRGRIANCVAQLLDLDDRIATLIEEIEGIRDDEQDAFDGMPESLQNGGPGERSQDALSALENAISDLERLDTAAIADSLKEASR